MIYTPFYRTRYMVPYKEYSNNIYSYKKKNEDLNNKNKSKPKNIEKKESKENKDSVNIFGLNLHLDDIILIALLIILFSEGVKDEMLFIILILLLLG